MKKKISFVVPLYYRENKVFDEYNKLSNRDDCLRPYVELKKALYLKNIIISTCDIIPPKEADLTIFWDIPDTNDLLLKEAISVKKPIFSIITELGYIHKANNNIHLHKCFDKIFTYQDELINGKKYIKLNYSFRFPDSVKVDYSKKEKLCVMIAGNKQLNYPNELYSERVRAIRWFEKNHPDDFDLYGIGWGGNKGFLRRIISKPYSSYKGQVEEKKITLKKYKFSICYENAYDVPGWITEKIFDCFFSGCIPIYWGISNIDKVIPPNCFIDKRKFKNYEELYTFLSNMTKKEYLEFIKNINEYLKSDKKYEFTIEYFLNTVINNITNYLR